ncbi:hypothetical protein ATE84_2693 [Aquimarina sp. MAR_2010_214]|uniref:hypothetical protein n=1 Tax=Aquimarina sp. MAR_2010_214 TaxID=1250026 RepID=UPI000CC726EB|nr:hypothetical protein [Aquimarina sp. MAR_2010_214]PKV50630.1 hypothetical protein ATE84_2693 [Aquimarina sp. MAR_2010_214]
MYFSTEVSFGADNNGSDGVVTLKKAQTRPQQVFTMIPILFALYQFTGGLSG